ncbi:MAG: DUF1294 domain-containing protein [Erysipelotrichales bacterium]|nr:DUF1294 domain-containing protein [Erysipelotrichales bacterium]
MPFYYSELVLFCYVLCCIIGFALMGIDKYFAIHGKWRISERILLLFGFIGGIGIWGGMYLFHHKTMKPKFYIGVPLLTVVFLIICSYIL